ncbi:MAG: DUF4198 domain-containing protein [Cytophagales bacterium]|nr:MAG: DUF4198 domain-containing protein [Cytophagales bacterium]
MKKKATLILCFLALFYVAQAHEFWLAFQKFMVNVGDAVPISFLVGEDFNGETWEGKMASFYLYNEKGKQNIADIFPAKPEEKTTLTFKSEGTHLLAFNSQNKLIELEPDKFLAYLEEDGLTEVIEMRKKCNETTKKGRESYQRCAKALVQVGGKTDNTFNTIAKHNLELLPEQNPYQLQAGDKLAFKLLFKNKVLPNTLVKIWHKNEGKLKKSEQRTDSKGIISFEMEKQGEYMVSAVQMIPHKIAKEADWQSYWASFTFGF